MPKTIFIDIIVLQNHERKDILEEKLGLEIGVCTSCGDNDESGTYSNERTFKLTLTVGEEVK